MTDAALVCTIVTAGYSMHIDSSRTNFGWFAVKAWGRNGEYWEAHAETIDAALKEIVQRVTEVVIKVG